MELHAVQRQALVPNAHDLPAAVRSIAPSADFELVTERARPDDETMIARRLERIVQVGEQPPSIVVNLVSLAVHQALGPHDFGPERVPDRLVPEANSEDRDFGRESRNALAGDSGFPGRPGAPPDNHALRPFSAHFFEP